MNRPDFFSFWEMSIEKYLWLVYFSRSTISKNMIRPDFFLGIFPRCQLNIVITLPNTELRRNISPATTIWDMIKCFGVIILITRYKFTSRSDMCSSRYQYNYIKPPYILNTGLTIPRFSYLWS